jgi:hypothetical protein
MGCDWVAIRNLMIALGIFISAASSSAIFVVTWMRFAVEGPWKPIVTAASLASVAGWCVPAIVMLAILMNTISTFCSCAGAITLRASACASLTPWLLPLMVFLLALAALGIAGSFDPELPYNPVYLVALSGVAIAAAVIMGFIAVFADRLIHCQG